MLKHSKEEWGEEPSRKEDQGNGTDGGIVQMTLVFGYGSLINRGSRKSTVPSATLAWPINITGLQRCWNATAGPGEISTTFLGDYENKRSTLNGVAFFATDAEVNALIRRESEYSPKHFSLSRIRWWAEQPPVLPETILVFCFAGNRQPTHSYPIIQSYVDICLSGCLAVDQSLNSSDFEFSRMFLRGTLGWSTHWVNDRRQPGVFYRHRPKTPKIDALLSMELPNEFRAIKIEK